MCLEKVSDQLTVTLYTYLSIPLYTISWSKPCISRTYSFDKNVIEAELKRLILSFTLCYSHRLLCGYSWEKAIIEYITKIQILNIVENGLIFEYVGKNISRPNTSFALKLILKKNMSNTCKHILPTFLYILSFCVHINSIQ